MTKIEVIVPFAIYENGSHRACSEGDVTEIEDGEAKRMEAAGFVKILGGGIETAESPEVETAEAPKPRRKKAGEQ